jgi:hydroxypyruvate isomerase
MKNSKNKNNLNRRQFVKGIALSTLAVTSTPLENLASSMMVSNPAHNFNLKYAPHFGMFKEHAGEDPIDQLRFMAEQGFTALEDNGMMGRSVSLQEKISTEMTRLGMTMGVFVAHAEFNEKTFVVNNNDVRAMLIEQMKKAVEVAKRVNAKWCTVVPGAFDTRLEWDYQTANVIENLKWCADVCEPSNLIMVLEPLNAWRDHPGLFLTKVQQAYQICKAVNNPSCKILDDLYHQQITEGNLIPNIDLAWSEIAYFQVGDNPGRKEPTTGEINFRNVFKHIFNKGFKGIIGMEHGNSLPGKKGELALIEAYKYCDDFK